MAMSSSSPDEDEDCIVAIKFLGPQLSLIRPARDSKWTNIRIKNPSLFTSHVIYSQRHEMFSMPASGGCHIGYWDLHDYRDKPRLQEIEFQNVPRLRKKERELFGSCYKTEHLVESSTGETFLVMWYRSFHDGTHAYTDPEPRELETKGFRVFKLDERGNASYTKDIGDLCIFISKAEAFCVPASSYCAPDKNFITYIDVHECIPDLELGSVDLDKADTHDMLDLITKIPYFFPPQLMQ